MKPNNKPRVLARVGDKAVVMRRRVLSIAGNYRAMEEFRVVKGRAA